MTSSQHGLYVLGYTHATMAVQWVAKPRGGANPESWSQFGLQAATRLHEVGVASNRASAYVR
jgi:hypothetical protein